eukprot:253505-Rhodomonas_salina.1
MWAVSPTPATCSDLSRVLSFLPILNQSQPRPSGAEFRPMAKHLSAKVFSNLTNTVPPPHSKGGGGEDLGSSSKGGGENQGAWEKQEQNKNREEAQAASVEGHNHQQDLLTPSVNPSLLVSFSSVPTSPLCLAWPLSASSLPRLDCLEMDKETMAQCAPATIEAGEQTLQKGQGHAVSEEQQMSLLLWIDKLDPFILLGLWPGDRFVISLRVCKSLCKCLQQAEGHSATLVKSAVPVRTDRLIRDFVQLQKGVHSWFRKQTTP